MLKRSSHLLFVLHTKRSPRFETNNSYFEVSDPNEALDLIREGLEKEGVNNEISTTTEHGIANSFFLENDEVVTTLFTNAKPPKRK